MDKDNHILTINSGSSSVKFALFQMGEHEKRQFSSSLEGVGESDARFHVHSENC
jgi:acetate kinase